MGKKTINAADLARDIRAGMSNTAIMEKHEIPTLERLKLLIYKLVTLGHLEKTEFVNRFKKVKCPACNYKQHDDFTNCPNCGIVVSKFIEQQRKFYADSRAWGKRIRKSVVIVYAGFWRRFFAYLLDTIIIIVCCVNIGIFVGVIIGAIWGVSESDLVTTYKTVGRVPGYIINVVLVWLYFTLLESSPIRATLGKIIMGINVTDLNNKQISFGKANGRYWGKIVSCLILLVGFLMAGFTQKKQALHDILAGTLVVKK